MTADDALVELLHDLSRRDYCFTAVTPATHARVLERAPANAPTLRDIFGWNRMFSADDLDSRLLELLRHAGAVEQDGRDLRSAIRVASLDGLLFAHSSFPTESSDAVFFGPDTYRFVWFVQRHLPLLPPPRRIVDMGCGSGAGGIIAARSCPAATVALVDVNHAALRLARINAEVAGVKVVLHKAGRLPPGGADLVIANPPYLMDGPGRTYRDGGSLLGGEVSLDWVKQALAAMDAGGTMLLYTGAAFIDGRSPLLDALEEACSGKAKRLALEEIDPDVFGEQLEVASYGSVERIAAVGAVIEV